MLFLTRKLNVFSAFRATEKISKDYTNIKPTTNLTLVGNTSTVNALRDIQLLHDCIQTQKCSFCPTECSQCHFRSAAIVCKAFRCSVALCSYAESLTSPALAYSCRRTTSPRCALKPQGAVIGWTGPAWVF